MKYLLSTSLFIAMALATSSCSEGIETGGGAGDTDDSATAIALITPLVGSYDLPPNWAGEPSSEAYLEIQEPANDGTATSVLYTQSEFNNCFDSDPEPGSVTKDLFSDRIFLDTFAFDSSVISGSGNNIIIDIGEDFQDVDNDGDTSDTAQLIATPLGFMAMDIDICQ